jgi:sulfur carrier protein ThiS
MKISVTLFGGLRQYLPAGSGYNNCDIEIEEGASLQTLLTKVAIPDGKPYLVMHNDTRITAEQYAELNIQSDDQVVLLPPIKGG